MVFNILTVFYIYHHSLILEHANNPPNKPHTHLPSFSIAVPPNLWQRLNYILSLWVCLLWIFQYK